MKQNLSSSKYSVTCFTGKNGIRELQPHWLSLETRVAEPAHHQMFAWHEAALHAGLLDEAGAVFVGVFDNGRIVAILPLELRPAHADPQHLRAAGFAVSPHLLLKDIVVDAGADPAPLLDFTFRWFRQQKEFPWDLLSLEKLPADSILHGLAARSDTVRCFEEVEGASAIIDCAGTEEQNLAHIPGKFRRNLGRLERKARKLGKVDIVSFSRGNDSARGIDEFINIENANWKGESGTSIASDQSLVAFYTRLMEADFRSIECRINLLRAGDRFVAGQFGFVTGDTLRLLKIGYRQDHADMGPGTLMMACTIRECSRNENIKRIDLVTAQEWSRVWRTEVLPVYSLAIFNSTPRGVFQFANRGMRKMARKVLKRDGKGDSRPSVNGN